MTKQALKRLLWLIFISIAITACTEKPEIVEQIRAIKTITVSEATTEQIRKFSGIVHATDSANLSFEVSGRMVAVKVDIGNRVKKGQVLAVLDKEPYRLAVDAAQAELVRAKAQIINTEAEYKRQERVYRQGAGAKSRLDSARYNYDAAKSGVKYQVTRLNLAKRNLRKTTLRAPYDGYIAWRSVEPHEEIKTGQKVLEINAKGTMEVQLAVPETMIHRLNIGVPVSVTSPTLPGKSVKGRITYVGSAATKANAFPIKVGLIDPPAKLSPGMTAEVIFVLKTERQETGYVIPIQAFLPGNESEQWYVFVYDPKTSAVRKTVVKGDSDVQNNMGIVYEGLSTGDIIAVAGVSFLADGMKVKLMKQ